jgi:hypothetical protein
MNLSEIDMYPSLLIHSQLFTVDSARTFHFAALNRIFSYHFFGTFKSIFSFSFCFSQHDHFTKFYLPCLVSNIVLG